MAIETSRGLCLGLCLGRDKEDGSGSKEEMKKRWREVVGWRTGKANQRGGDDKNSTQEFGLGTQEHSETSTHFSCQIHVATEVLLDLGTRLTKQLYYETRSGKQLEHSCWSQTGQASFTNQSNQISGTWPLTARGNWSDWFGKLVRSVLSRTSPKDQRGQSWVEQTQNPTKLEHGKATIREILAYPKLSSKAHKWLNWSDWFLKPVRPVLPGQSEELSPREKLDLHSNRSPDSFHRFKWDFVDSRGTSWATFGQKLKPQNSPNQKKSKVNLQNHLS
jgi:hypothetical protein